MLRLPIFLLLRRSSDLPGELEIKSWSEILRTHKFPRNESEIKPASFREQHPGLVFLKARSELDLLLLLSVSAAASVSGTDEGAGKCIEIFAISPTV